MLGLFWLRRHRRQHVLWRLSAVPWAEEQAQRPLDWLPSPCPECRRWGEKWQRLHAALRHIAKPVGGPPEADRCCSASGRASTAVRRAGPEDACQYWLHCIVAPRAAIAWDCRNLAAEATLNGFALGDFAASCLKRRDAGHYAHAWGVKLQEVLLDRMQLGTCTVMSMKLNESRRAGASVRGDFGTSQKTP
ncbi:unnamed protein product [Symbiodinium natans]|uniref:Uncharacterized protein n=1 Tax=Symbiodinium natans TaxID=878477 RepID=A0A812J0S8_9DINO|nr:unnamed protein product [Symbiodinium natans]